MTYCSKCGKPTDQKADNLFICEIGHENYINPILGAVVFVMDGDKVLYGVRNREPNTGGLSAPGGLLELTDTLESAGLREVKEEMGIDVELVDFLGSYSTFYGDRRVLNSIFIAKYVGGDITPSDDMSGGDPQWRSVNDLPTLDELSWDWYPPAQKDLQEWYKRNR